MTERPQDEERAQQGSEYDPDEDPDTDAPASGELVERDAQRDQAEGE